jgi:uncharacterized lipoprotein YajG
MKLVVLLLVCLFVAACSRPPQPKTAQAAQPVETFIG